MSDWDFGRVIESTASGRAWLKRVREDGIETKEATYFEKMLPSETPLLVDVLAEAVRELLPCVSGSGRAKSAALGRAALARYQEEVGDACDISHR